MIRSAAGPRPRPGPIAGSPSPGRFSPSFVAPSRLVASSSSWDIVYYLGLRLAIGWPPSLETWDVLFLVPAPWVGPVWAPILVSVALVGSGLAAARRLRAGRQIVVGPMRALVALAGGALVIASFLIDSSRVLAGDSGAWTGWPVFLAGLALATVATVSALAGRSPAAAHRGMRSQHGSERRPSVGAPD